ncbi:synaptobrevin-domain-containing protein [Chytriomyces sp. MP71]|nr:synaptobrevin-domain-containing protein [Chytriomyces sp. MP71]
MSKTQQIQAQVQETIGVMNDNIHKVVQRGERLEDLNERSENLAQSSEAFKARSKEVRMKMFWQDTKTKVILGGVAVVVIGLIVGLSVWGAGVGKTTTTSKEVGGPNPNATSSPVGPAR